MVVGRKFFPQPPAATTNQMADEAAQAALVQGADGGGGGLLFADLPTDAGVGTRSFITDNTGTTFLAAAVGGGTDAVPVVFDGTDWLVG